MSPDPDRTWSPHGLLEMARRHAPGWESADTAQTSALGGGITNQLFHVQAPGRPSLVLRRYGPRTEVVIDRRREVEIVRFLAERQMAPPLYGLVEGGRVEGFLDGHRALVPEDLPHHAPAIGAGLAALHALPFEDGAPHRLWDRLRRWFAVAQELRLPEPAREARREALRLGERAAALEAEIAAIEALGPHPALRPVLAHNDLLSGNVLLHEATGAVRFIDFEYADRSPAAFDLANHLCEYTGFASDFERDFPRRPTRRALVAAYLGAEGPQVDDWLDVVDRMVLIDHLFWGVWAVVQAAHSPIDFDFLRYAELRLGGYDLHQGGLP